MNNSYFKRRRADNHNEAYVPGSNPPKVAKVRMPKLDTSFDMPMQDLVKDKSISLAKKFKEGIHYIWVRYGGRKKAGNKTPAKFYRKVVYLAKAGTIWVPPHHEVIRRVIPKLNKFGHYVPS